MLRSPFESVRSRVKRESKLDRDMSPFTSRFPLQNSLGGMFVGDQRVDQACTQTADDGSNLFIAAGDGDGLPRGFYILLGSAQGVFIKIEEIAV